METSIYDKLKIGVAIPAYNEENFIEETLKNVPKYVDVIVAVNDGSTDSTLKRMIEFQDNRLKIINQKNQGVGAAIQNAFKKLLDENCDLLVVVNGDNQMDQSNMHLLISPFLELETCTHTIFTKGDRLSRTQNRKSMPRTRLFGNYLTSLITRTLIKCKVSDPLNGYTCVSSCFIKSSNEFDFRQDYCYEISVISNINLRKSKIIEIPMKSIYRNEISTLNPITTFLKICFYLIKLKFNQKNNKIKKWECEK